ncbi:hypothetical protein LMG31841_04309 [Paraburkholderia saeva]|uniref:Uncharacterized protein n=1 Tax=Paraburkholderia saeva TaxID=2777537 RepID=A0A9N8RYQ1_9BURK|nr:hypothetical protein R70241_00600 [Paraburkholderia saeva]CAG4913864.1 hypothetical protein LMG31841_04309 [Paraburkholderia saeva]
MLHADRALSLVRRNARVLPPRARFLWARFVRTRFRVSGVVHAF